MPKYLKYIGFILSAIFSVFTFFFIEHYGNKHYEEISTSHFWIFAISIFLMVNYFFAYLFSFSKRSKENLPLFFVYIISTFFITVVSWFIKHFIFFEKIGG